LTSSLQTDDLNPAVGRPNAVIRGRATVGTISKIMHSCNLLDDRQCARGRQSSLGGRSRITVEPPVATAEGFVEKRIAVVREKEPVEIARQPVAKRGVPPMRQTSAYHWSPTELTSRCALNDRFPGPTLRRLPTMIVLLVPNKTYRAEPIWPIRMFSICHRGIDRFMQCFNRASPSEWPNDRSAITPGATRASKVGWEGRRSDALEYARGDSRNAR
jgi:hypothetical protein